MYFILSRTSSVKIDSSLYSPYFNIYGVPQSMFLALYCSLFIFFIKSMFHKYHNINYHLYDDDLQIYSHIIIIVIQIYYDQIYMFNCITDLTNWFSHNSISYNMTKTILSYSQDTVLLYQSLIFSTISSNFSIYNYSRFYYNLSTRLISTH